MQVETSRSLNGTLEELFNEYVDPPKMELQENAYPFHAIKDALLGKAGETKFRICPEGNDLEVFLSNRELLARFASLSQGDLRKFFQCVRLAMHTNQVATINLKVEWSPQKTRVLEIRQFDGKIFGEGSLLISMAEI